MLEVKCEAWREKFRLKKNLNFPSQSWHIYVPCPLVALSSEIHIFCIYNIQYVLTFSLQFSFSLVNNKKNYFCPF